MDVVGSLALGVFVGYLAWYFVTRFTQFNFDALASVIGVLVGGAVVQFLGATGDARWAYPIGLVAGWLIYSVARMLTGSGWPTLTSRADRQT